MPSATSAAHTSSPRFSAATMAALNHAPPRVVRGAAVETVYSNAFRNNGSGAAPDPPLQPWMRRSSMNQPPSTLPTEASLVMRKRKRTVWPAKASRFTTTRDQSCGSPHHARRPTAGLPDEIGPVVRLAQHRVEQLRPGAAVVRRDLEKRAVVAATGGSSMNW